MSCIHAMALLSLAREHLPGVCDAPDSLFDIPMVILSSAPCFKATLSRAIGLAIVVLAGIIKVPQILAIINAKSAEGISSTTMLLETFGYIYNLAAHFRMSYPVTTYGDFAVLILQNCAIVYLVYYYSGQASRGASTVLAFAALLAVMCSTAFPLNVLRALTLGNVALSIASRVPQITRNFRNKSTGTLSAVTCWGVFLGSLARVFTTLQDVDSTNILIGYLCSSTLNGIIAFQVIVYRRGPVEKLE